MLNFALCMKTIRTHWFIHGFALLHAATTLVCTLAGIHDSLLLTALTMALAVIICLRENLTVEITIISLVLVNILGFTLGDLTARWVFVFLPEAYQHVLSTFLVTEVLGWSLYGFAHVVQPAGSASYERKLSWHRNMLWLVLAILAVYGLRIYIDLTYQGDLFRDSGAVGVLVLLTAASLGYMVTFAVQMQREASQQRTRRHQAEYNYMNLKNQVNPHFLFNSLNVLDSIVQDGTREEASEYIHKMAAIYRYMMQQEGKRLVPLADELAYARNYQELILIRFPEGLEFRDGEAGSEDGSAASGIPAGYIVPCTLQLLLENAIKHNAIGPDNPLIVSVTCADGHICVSNNRIPKRSSSPSTGIGLQYIRNQYRDIAGAEISVEETAGRFSVTIPILTE